MKRIFYSHAKKSYGTAAEAKQLAIIKERFPGDEVLDPSKDQTKFASDDEEMRHYLGIIDGCDSIVFSRLNGVVTEGVLKEVNHALAGGKPVYEIRGRGRVVKVTKPFEKSSKANAVGYLLSEFFRRRSDG